MESFKDYFSKQSDIYLKYRPRYPKELYSFLTSLTHQHDTAWDCGTGNGQAALGLTPYYKKIIATDPSEQQLTNAIQHSQIVYKQEKAEQTSISDQSVDLLTIANALHWFNFDLFYKEVRRVVKPGGIIAAWANNVLSAGEVFDKPIEHYHNVTLNNYWLPENRLIEQEYKTIPFPFETISTPEFNFKTRMNLDDLIGYLNTWSATQRYINETKQNPTEQVYNELLPHWKDPKIERTFTWNVILKVGRV